jgi:hypothetical protein
MRDYRTLLRVEGITTLEKYQSEFWADKLPLKSEFLSFQREAAASFVHELGNLAAKVAGQPIAVGVNAYNLAPTQLATSHHADYFANEVEHYGVEETIPPMVYKLADALGKPVFSTGSGHDWIKVAEEKNVVRVQRWIATAHIFGHYFMYAYNKWGYSEKTGTKWYMTPVSTYKPLCGFITDNADLFDDYESVAQVGLLYSNSACLSNNWEVRDIARELHDASIPFGLIVAGDDWLKHPLTEEKLADFELIIIPERHMLTGAQADLVKRWKQQGKAVEWTSVEDILARVQPMVTLETAEKVWALPRQIIGSASSSIVIHLLNQDYDGTTDSMRKKERLQVHLGSTLLNGRALQKVTYFRPDAEAVELNIQGDDQDINVTVPELMLWGILRID